MADEISDRLRDARIRAGYKSAAAAARAHGWTEGAYRHHENGTRGFDLKTAIIYANAFDANARYLLGLDPAFDTAGVHEFFNNVFEPTADVKFRSTIIRVVRKMFGIELVRAINPARESGVGHDLNFDDEKYHAFNREFLDSIDPKLAEGNVAVLIMEGTTMSPTAPDGSMLLVDTRSRMRDWPDDIWVVYSDDGLVVRRVKYDGDELILSAENTDVADIRAPAGEYGSVGRVRWIGKPVS